MRLRPFAPLILVTCCALGASACSSDEGVGGAARGTDGFVFGTAGSPQMFDPFMSSEGETFRVTRQMFEGLVTIKPDNQVLSQGLATKWDKNAKGTVWTFTLREGVKFHDDTPFNAAAVCKNFQRMFSLTAQGSAVTSYYWDLMMGGYQGSTTPSLYKSCAAPSPTTAVITLNRASTRFPALLGLPPFAMQSPTAMEKYQANQFKRSDQGTGSYPEYATAHPTGTGPFVFDAHHPKDGKIVLKRNEDYWGQKAKLEKVTFVSIPNENVRRQELLNGNIQAYDLPNPADWKALKDRGMTVMVRSPRNLLYLGLNAAANPQLKDVRVRKAIMMAINREQLVKTQLPESAVLATQFVPANVPGYNSSIKAVPWQPQAAMKLLADAGATGMTLELWYPTEVSRPYMPQPARIFEAIRADLEIAGIKIKPVSKPWNGGYLDGVDAGKASAYLLGTTHEVNSFDGYYGLLFGKTNGELQLGTYPFGQALVDSVLRSDGLGNEVQRNTLNLKIAADVMNSYVPAIPIAFSTSALVTDKSVSGLQISPLTDESFKDVYLAD